MAKKTNLYDQLEKAKTDHIFMNRFIDQHKAFIASELSKVLKRYVHPQHAPFMTIGMLAFHDAVMSYVEEKGLFVSYASLIIKRRAIDELRKESKQIQPIEDELEVALMPKSMDVYRIEGQREERIIAITEFGDELESWGITLTELTKKSPKNAKLRDLYKSMAKAIAEDHGIKQAMYDKRRLSITDLMNKFQVNRRKIERGRIFIVACVLLYQPQYKSIHDYVK